MKSAMRSGEKSRLQTIRLILAAIKQQEVDTRKELTDQDVITILTKMQKQRRESISQFEKASRQDLIDKESSEMTLINKYLPEALNETEIDEIIQQVLSESGATTIKDMGKIMSILKSKLSGRTDMSLVSAKIKDALNS